MKPYPVPLRGRWRVCIQFLDGSQIYGMSDEEVLERWMHLGFWQLDNAVPHSPENFMLKAASYAERVYGVEVPPFVDTSSFLEALAEARVFELIRK